MHNKLISYLLLAIEVLVIGVLAGILNYRLQETGNTVSGTAFFIDSQGYIATAAHVVKGRSKFKILYEGNVYNATLVEANYVYDIAILKTTVHPSIFIPLTEKLVENSSSGLYGYPRGTHLLTLTQGKYTTTGLFTTTVVIHYTSCHGNSGGPIINTQGQAIGIQQHGYDPFVHYCSQEGDGVSTKYLIKDCVKYNIPFSTQSCGRDYPFSVWYSVYNNVIVYIEASK